MIIVVSMQLFMSQMKNSDESATLLSENINIAVEW